MQIRGLRRPVSLFDLPWRAPGAVAGCVLAGSLITGCGGDADPGAAATDPAATAATGEAPWFTEVTAAAGLGDFRHVSGADGRYLMPEIMTTGAALVDVNGDGALDVYLAQAGGVDQARAERPGNQLYLGDGKGHFRNVTDGSGADDRGYAMGVATGDYDGDGDMDLYVSNLERNALLQNDGQGHFTDVTEAAGVGGSSWSASAVFVDADSDGDLDLFVTNYIYWALDGEIDCRSPQGVRTYCSPKSYGAPAPDSYFENQGDRTFVDASERVGLRAAFGNGLGVVCADFDLDGRPEIFVANDGTPNQLWDPQPDGTFKETALISGCAVDVQGAAKAGMGVSVADIDADGDEDLLVVNLTGEDDSFYRNDSGQFVDRTPARGLAVVSRKRTRFGVALRDFDLDGHLDLFHANGRVTQPERAIEGDPFAEENMLLRGNAAGRFQEVLPRGGVAVPLVATSRSAAFGDIDGDGDVDILVHNRDAGVHLYRNDVANSRKGVTFELLDEHGAPAIGAAIFVRTPGHGEARHEVRTTDSYGAASSPLIHVGAGDGSAPMGYRILWADGTEGESGACEAGAAIKMQRSR
ncbi:FG-GAP repeat protein [Planctomycetes bacterium Poly30]|uniref:FG-GAP repeat protein n=1 Tax=Saltatorellus ferox TaxID=2528018 RepID=A0A518EMY8_9BACT|nr:FG-GAP repeat protein [Planctomycetes bacterium Poly30]